MASFRLLSAAGLVLCLASFSATGQKYPVQVSHYGNDQVGRVFSFELREGIRGSQSMLLTESPDIARIRIVIVSIESGDSSSSSALAKTILYDSPEVPLSGLYLTTIVHVCGRSRVGSCVRATMADIDTHVSRLRSASPSLWQTLF